MASSSFNRNNNTDIWSWLINLPPLHQWKTTSISTSLCSITTTTSPPPPTLNLTLTKTPTNLITLSITIPTFKLPISLWTSKPIKPSSSSSRLLLDEEPIQTLLINIIQDVLGYGPYGQNKSNYTPPSYGANILHNFHQTIIKIPSYYKAYPTTNDLPLEGIFTLSLLVLVFLVIIYEAPLDLRSSCLNILKNKFGTSQSRESSKHLMRMLGSNLEEQWMRSLNLAITNWKVELMSVVENQYIIKCDSPLFSFAMSGYGMWKIHVYCPVIAMEIENSNGSGDDQLMFSLNYHQLEGVIQLNYKVVVKEKWVELQVNIDNIRLDVVRLVSEKLLAEQGAGESEKHFPSTISVQLTPYPHQNDYILGISVSKSTDNPLQEVEHERTFEGSFEPPNNIFPALKMSTGETTTTTMRPWKFEESAIGDTGTLSWFLQDVGDGREVFSSKPSKIAIFHPRAWFRNRYSSANRPFTRRGGVVFASDAYGETVCWKIDKRALGRRMDWEVKGCVGVTYLPNKYRRRFYSDTRKAVFKDYVNLTLG